MIPTMDRCSHLLRVAGMCAQCGKEVFDEDVSALYTRTDLRLGKEVARTLQEEARSVLHREKKLWLILDIDETILHSSIDDGRDADGLEHFSFRHGSQTYRVVFRPGLKEFLGRVSAKYEIHVYTMGIVEYISKIVAHLDPDGRYFGGRIVARENNETGNYKTIDRLFYGARDCVVIVDDNFAVWNFCDNHVPVLAFVGDPHDCELERVSDVLEQLWSAYWNDGADLAALLRKSKLAVLEHNTFFFEGPDCMIKEGRMLAHVYGGLVIDQRDKADFVVDTRAVGGFAPRRVFSVPSVAHTCGFSDFYTHVVTDLQLCFWDDEEDVCALIGNLFPVSKRHLLEAGGGQRTKEGPPYVVSLATDCTCAECTSEFL